MKFKVAARTIYHLGAELISSDAVALYELIKNSFDAGSPTVKIEVCQAIDLFAYRFYVEELLKAANLAPDDPSRKSLLRDLKELISRDLENTAPTYRETKDRLARADTPSDLQEALDAANFVAVTDKGSGMNSTDLEDVYLTIGTRHRYLQRQERKHSGPHDRPLLGEKGIGRLAVMRIGDRVTVRSTTKDDSTWSVLTINWSQFSHDTDKLIEQIEIPPLLSEAKEDPAEQGTTVKVTALSDNWSIEKLKSIAGSEFCRLTDPFSVRHNYPITLIRNGITVKIPELDKKLFSFSHASLLAKYELVKEGVDEFGNERVLPRLSGTIRYISRSREYNFSLGLPELISIVKIADQRSAELLRTVGAFEVEAYWYNRRLFNEIKSIDDKAWVRDIQKIWGGGLMVYRDGFRVNPYGSSDDDWLDLDPKAFGSGGYKMNRSQIVGRAAISSSDNPKLVDQSNREGLIDSPEKDVFIRLLKHLLLGELKPFLDRVDKEVSAREPIGFDEFAQRVHQEQKRINHSLAELARNPSVGKDHKVVKDIEDSVEKLMGFLAEAEKLADEYEEGRERLLNLAGLGMMVEIVAHELHRATAYAQRTLVDLKQRSLDKEAMSACNTLESQINTLRRRLSILDPVSTSSRHRKQAFNFIAWVEEIVDSHAAQFQQENITCSVTVIPQGSARVLQVNMVKGMVVQVFENLISNSLYWLHQNRLIDRNFRAKIDIAVDIQKKTVYFSDNGPGVKPERSELIFQPFVTTKPPGEGRGLGLYIARQIAEYHGAKLALSTVTTTQPDRLNTFVFTL